MKKNNINKQKNIWAIGIVTLAIIAGGIWYKSVNYNQILTSQAKEHPKSFIYQGREGVSALDLLREKNAVKTQTFEGMGELVVEIEGIKPEQNQFWSYYVNGKPAQVSADTLITHKGDVIEWKLKTFNTQ